MKRGSNTLMSIHKWNMGNVQQQKAKFVYRATDEKRSCWRENQKWINQKRDASVRERERE